MHKSMYPFSVSLFSVALFVKRRQIGPRILQTTIAKTRQTLHCPPGMYVRLSVCISRVHLVQLVSVSLFFHYPNPPCLYHSSFLYRHRTGFVCLQTPPTACIQST